MSSRKIVNGNSVGASDREILRGTVKWFNNQKGYGFIGREDGRPDLFIHHSNINQQGYRSLTEGQLVQFEVSQTAGKTQAVNVTVVVVE